VENKDTTGGTRHPWFAWCVAAVTMCAPVLMAGCSRRPPADLKPLDVVLITVDTLRMDHVSAFCPGAARTPAIDQFASTGLLFEQAITAAPVTSPSLSTLLTSRYPHETTVTDNGYALPTGIPTLTELLHGYGYRTDAIVSNPVLRPPGSLSHGFDLYDTDLPQRELARPTWKERRADATTDRALEVLRRRDPHGRLFLWVHYNDPHGPYAPPTARPKAAPADEPSLPVNTTNSGRDGIPKYQFIWNERAASRYRERYGQEVEFLDSQLARLFAVLDQPAFRDHTLVIFTADHGESLGEHNYYFAHGEYLYPELIDVPLIVRAPGLATGRRTDLVGLVDILPSVAAFLHLPVDSPVRGDAVFEHPAPAGRTLSVCTYIGNSVIERLAIVRSDEELIFSAPSATARVTLELLHAGRPVPLDAGDPRTEVLKAALHRLIDENQLNSKETDRPMLSKETVDRLRSLGYLR
jgi:choline-sulfatase